MSKLVYETRKVNKLPENLIKEGYKAPAFVRVYKVSEGKYEIMPSIDFDFGNADDFLDKGITTLLFEGKEEEAIKESERILEDVENWPKY
ncbi:MAG: hypothetical protein QXN01_04495 [Candidatus Anstonellales archaeon]